VGVNTLSTKVSNDVISEDDVNQYKTAITDDLIPRNSSGVITDIAGNLGTSVYRWVAGYIKSLYIGTIANNNSITEVSNDLEISSDYDINLDAGSGREIDLRFNGTALGSGITSSGISRDMLGAVNYSKSSSCGSFSGSSTSYADITNLSTSITTTGKPVMLYFESASTTTGSNISSTATTDVKLLRDSTDIALYRTSTSSFELGVPLIIDVPSSGTYTYKAQYKVSSGSVAINTYRLVAIEL
jgi:hypothetical protein